MLTFMFQGSTRDNPVMIWSSATQIDCCEWLTLVANTSLGANSEPLASMWYVLVTLTNPIAPSEVQ
jgi:hypothetical protein